MTAIRELAPEERPFRRHGLGWRFQPPEAAVLLTFDRLSERGGDTWAEVHVTTLEGGHLCRRRVNLLGGSSLNGLIKECDDMTSSHGWPWKRIVASGAESTLEAFRRGESTETFSGRLRKPAGVRWLCHGLVQADVINCWLAAAGTGKSTFATGLCVAHALGERFLGRDVPQGVPLYLDWESTTDDFEEKLYLAAAGMGRDEIPPIHRIRMRGSLRSRVHQIGERIDRLGVTLMVIDAVAAAGGSPGENNYEAVALELEETLQILPPVTALLLDHVTGDDLRNGTVPLKGRGSTRKVEFIRNQWTLTLDREGMEDARHVVGWTHTKINRGRLMTPFGVEVVHDEDSVTFERVAREDVAPLAERMPFWLQMEQLMTRQGPMDAKQIAFLLLGNDGKVAQSKVRTTISRDAGKRFVRLPDGRIASRDRATSPALRAVPKGPDELPF